MPTKPFEYVYPGILVAQAIYAAVKFRIPDLIASGPKTVSELALESGAHEPTLDRLLRALTSIDLFVRTPDGRYRNSPLTEVLRADHPQSLSAEASFYAAPFLWRPLGAFSESVRTGEPAFDLVFGESFFAYLAAHPEEAAVYNRVMTHEILWATPALLRACDFSRFKRLVDVGGGQGALLSNILAATPQLQGILFDRPQVVAEAKQFVKGDVAKRVKIVGGDFFDLVPEGGDAYLMRKVIHDWEDEDAMRILRNVRHAMDKNSTLLLIERLIGSAANSAGLLDLLMMVLHGSRERTEAGFRSLVESAGFSLSRVVPAGDYCLIECRPA